MLNINYCINVSDQYLKVRYMEARENTMGRELLFHVSQWGLISRTPYGSP